MANSHDQPIIRTIMLSLMTAIRHVPIGAVIFPQINHDQATIRPHYGFRINIPSHPTSPFRRLNPRHSCESGQQISAQLLFQALAVETLPDLLSASCMARCETRLICPDTAAMLYKTATYWITWLAIRLWQHVHSQGRERITPERAFKGLWSWMEKYIPRS